jgi:hypothetical protein
MTEFTTEDDVRDDRVVNLWGNAMPDADPVDLMQPWTIKSVATRVSKAITAAARRDGLTTGQLMERMWDAWERGGKPVAVEPVNVVADLATLLHAAGALPEHTPVPREVRALINDYARMARGLPGQKPRQTEDGHTELLTGDDRPRIAGQTKSQTGDDRVA